MRHALLPCSLRAATFVCGALLLYASYRHPAPADLGQIVGEAERLGSPGQSLAMFLSFAALFGVVHRKSLRSRWVRIARGAYDDRDARAGRVAVGAVVIFGFALRIAGAHEYGFNTDEAQFVYCGAAHSLTGLWALVVRVSPHPPTNCVMLHFLEKLSWDPLWLRLPSILSGTLLIWLSHRFGRNLFGPGAGLAMAVLVAFSPAMIDLSRVSRNYMPGFVFLVLSVDLMVRYLRSGEGRRLAEFAIVAPLASVWHYSFMVVFIALGLIAVIELSWRRRPLRAWLSVAAAHLPMVAVMGFLYFAHVSRISENLVRFHRVQYRSTLAPELGDFARPFEELWRYLEIPLVADVCFFMSAVGLLGLLVNRQRLELLVCLTPLVTAYAFSWGEMLPLGGSRHGSFLFPFLFGLVASQVPELLSGFQRTRSNLRRLAPRRWRWEPRSLLDEGVAGKAETGRLGAPALGAVIVAVTAAALVGAALLRIDPGTTSRDRLRVRRELPTWYRLEDVARGFELLAERVGKNDLVVLQTQGLCAVQAYYHDRPPETVPQDWMIPRRPEPVLSRGGVTYHVAHTGLATTPESLQVAVSRVVSDRGMAEPDRVWTVQGSWETPLGEQFRERFPELVYDRDVERESAGLVFAVDMHVLRAAGGEARPHTPRRRRSK